MGSNPMRAFSATQAKNRFGSVLAEVLRTDEPILIERSGRPVAVILSIQAYQNRCQSALPFDADKVELARSAFGLWAGRDDIDDTWLERSRNRWRSEWTDA